jgi:DNA-binding GntR family transcriptional regulator
MSNQTLGEVVYLSLKEWMIKGKLRPGQRLMYDYLGEELNVSQAPIKEAFLRLEKEGLVEIIPRRGTFVKYLTEKDIIEFYEIREVLEGLSARLACMKMEQSDLGYLKKCCAELKIGMEEKDSMKCLESDIKFHKKIVEASGNDRLMNIMSTHLLTNLFMVTDRGEVYLKLSEKALADHLDLIDAFEKKQCARAEKLMTKQLRRGRNWILKSLNKSFNKKIAGETYF